MTYSADALTVEEYSFYSHASCEAWHFLFTAWHTWLSFYSHASCEAWQIHQWQLPRGLKFLLTCLLRGMTADCQNLYNPLPCFYSHASCEAWRAFVSIPTTTTAFLLTCLLRGMTAIFCVFFAIMPLYTRSRLFNKYILLLFSGKSPLFLRRT